jgi:hypothetical protein
VRTGGGALNRFWASISRLVLILGVTASVALAIASCGSSATGPPSAGAPNNILRAAEIEKYEPGDVERTFLEYWSNLQFHSWAEVAAYYDPDFRDFVGTARLIEAKKTGASVYPTLQPEIIRSTTNDGTTTVYYSLRLEDGSLEPASTSWRREGGNWQMIHDSRLDAELAQVAQERVQYGGDRANVESSEPLSAEALQAGKVAANMQARFLEEELEVEAP